MTNSFADIRTIRAASVPIAAALCRIAKIAQTVNQMVHWREANSKVSPGLLIETLVICILCGRKPLWKIEQFWAQQDLRNLFAEVDLSVEQLNDDAYGHALDKLAEISMEQLVSMVSLSLLQAHSLGINIVHFDTTSKSVQGAYTGKAHAEFKINHGFSKDLRPDLKQFKLGAAVQEDGLVIMGELLAGNMTDVQWNPEAAVEMQKLFTRQGLKDVIFAADCALISTNGLKSLAEQNVQFISRFPETFGLAKELKELAWEQDKWQDIAILASNENHAARYRVFPAQRQIDDQEYRFLVVHSSMLEAGKEKTLTKRISKQKEEWARKAKTLTATAFACEPDARNALQAFALEVAKYGYSFSGTVACETVTTYAHKGRPKKGEEPIETISYRIHCEIGDLAPDLFERLRQMESTFVLIYSIRDQEKYTPAAVFNRIQTANLDRNEVSVSEKSGIPRSSVSKEPETNPCAGVCVYYGAHAGVIP
ncbi:IS1634 family transposase [Paradesulfitobacterium ferrireducens]|uniref:IS1634 family transposase n=1 Tax=Paradesulfitobacterium ferrireducens TaxID=2816476 RepID=UPI001A8D6784|nr:IS1634 family transposase [Paradesulfitobacterium ferrireducens]